MKADKKTFGKILKEKMMLADMKQADLQKKLNKSQQAISHWCNGDTMPPTTVMKQIADVFGCTIDSFLASPITYDKEINELANQIARLSENDRKIVVDLVKRLSMS